MDVDGVVCVAGDAEQRGPVGWVVGDQQGRAVRGGLEGERGSGGGGALPAARADKHDRASHGRLPSITGHSQRNIGTITLSVCKGRGRGRRRASPTVAACPPRSDRWPRRRSPEDGFGVSHAVEIGPVHVGQAGG